MKKIFCLFFISFSNYALANNIVTGVDVAPYTTSCIKNNPCIVRSDHYASVINSNMMPKIIYVKYTICPQKEDCAIDTYQIVVNNGTWSDTKTMKLMAKYHYTGDFYLDAETSIFDENHMLLKTLRKRAKIFVNL